MNNFKSINVLYCSFNYRMAARTAKNGTKIIKSRKVDIRLRSSISDDECKS